MKEMVGKGNVPFLIAKEGVELAHSRVLLLIAPCEFPVLKVDFFKVTSVKGAPEVRHAATVTIVPVGRYMNINYETIYIFSLLGIPY